jgi:excisionase family DNA binding protein
VVKTSFLDEASKYFRISKPTFLNWVHPWKINAVKIGIGWRILNLTGALGRPGENTSDALGCGSY